MTARLNDLLKEFRENLEVKTDFLVRQAKELKSIQKAIFAVAEKEWENLSYQERAEVDKIIKDETSWWATDVS